jgi:PAS domain S-box-containing protein
LSTPLSVLIIEDDSKHVALVVRLLRRGGYDPDYKAVDNSQALEDALRDRLWDIVLSDYDMPTLDGLKALRLVRGSRNGETPVIFVSGTINEEDAVDLMHNGAQDFVRKNNLGRLVGAIDRELRVSQTRLEKRRAEEAAETERRLLRQLMDSMPDIIAFKDLQRRYTHVNRATCQLFNRSEGAIIGQTVDAFDTLEEGSARRKDEEEVLVTGRVSANRLETKTLPDGSVRWFLASRAPLRDQSGAITGLAMIARDITDSLRNLEARQAAADRFRKVLELAGDGIVAVDEDQRINLFNSAAENIFGYQSDEVVGQPLDILLPLSVMKVHRTHIGDFSRASELSKNMSSRRSVLGRRKNGEEFRAEATISKFVEDGETTFVAVVRDITERLQLQEQLIHSQKMEAIGALTGGVAHDFNNLLMVIIGNLDLLGDIVSSNPDAKELLEGSLTAAMSGADLARSLLAFGRRQALHPEQIDINGLMVEQVQLLKRTLGENIIINLNLANDGCQLVADASQLCCAIMNLALNARDAMPNGGTLAIEVRNTVFSADEVREYEGLEPGEYAVVSISDTGQGIASDDIRRIFEPFFTTKEVGKGTGLGLSMVYGFVKQSGGMIKVTSEMGMGATFAMYLPRTQEARVPAGAPIRAASQGKSGQTILVVDDSLTVLTTVNRQIRSLGYRTIAVNSAAEALDVIAGSEPCDLLMTDVVMPGMNGIELARAARERRRHLKVLLTSGFPDLKGTIGADASLFHAILRKPYRREELRRAIGAALEAPSDGVPDSAL